MTLYELVRAVEDAEDLAHVNGVSTHDVIVTLQLDSEGSSKSIQSCANVELHYDNDCQASGCVLTAITL